VGDTSLFIAYRPQSTCHIWRKVPSKEYREAMSVEAGTNIGQAKNR
jgi:hypothetical protein